MNTTNEPDINKIVSSEVSSQMFDKVYSKENVVKNYTSLITDLIDQYKSKLDLYDTQKEILFLNDNKEEQCPPKNYLKLLTYSAYLYLSTLRLFQVSPRINSIFLSIISCILVL